MEIFPVAMPILYIRRWIRIVSVKQEAALLINDLPDETVGMIIKLLKSLIPRKEGTAVDVSRKKVRLGIADGRYAIPDDIDSCNEEIARMFGVAE